VRLHLSGSRFARCGSIAYLRRAKRPLQMAKDAEAMGGDTVRALRRLPVLASGLVARRGRGRGAEAVGTGRHGGETSRVRPENGTKLKRSSK
jgi:hypothetical protein